MKQSEETLKMLKKLFQYSVSDSKIKKVIKDRYGKYYNKDYKVDFYKKYLSSFFKLNKFFKSEMSTCFSILNVIIVFAFISNIFAFILNNDGRLIILGLMIIFSFVLIMFGFRMDLNYEKKHYEQKINYDKNELIEQFADDNLIYWYDYTDNEKLNEEQFKEVIQYIKKHMTKEDITEYLILNNKEDITEIASLKLLLSKIKSEQEKKERESLEINKRENIIRIIDRF